MPFNIEGNQRGIEIDPNIHHWLNQRDPAAASRYASDVQIYNRKVSQGLWGGPEPNQLYNLWAQDPSGRLAQTYTAAVDLVAQGYPLTNSDLESVMSMAGTAPADQWGSIVNNFLEGRKEEMSYNKNFKPVPKAGTQYRTAYDQNKIAEDKSTPDIIGGSGEDIVTGGGDKVVTGQDTGGTTSDSDKSTSGVDAPVSDTDESKLTDVGGGTTAAPKDYSKVYAAEMKNLSRDDFIAAYGKEAYLDTMLSNIEADEAAKTEEPPVDSTLTDVGTGQPQGQFGQFMPSQEQIATVQKMLGSGATFERGGKAAGMITDSDWDFSDPTQAGQHPGLQGSALTDVAKASRAGALADAWGVDVATVMGMAAPGYKAPTPPPITDQVTPNTGTTTNTGGTDITNTDITNTDITGTNIGTNTGTNTGTKDINLTGTTAGIDTGINTGNTNTSDSLLAGIKTTSPLDAQTGVVDWRDSMNDVSSSLKDVKFGTGQSGMFGTK